MSSHLQEVIAYLGSDYVFEEASHLLAKLLGIGISAKQLQTVSEYFGGLLEEEVQKQDDTSVSTGLEVTQEVYTYVQCPIFIADGAPWIWDWVEKQYPHALQILDFYGVA